MIDWSTILVVVILLAAILVFVVSVVLLVIGAYRIHEDRASGHFMFWPGGLLTGTLLAAGMTTELETNAPTFGLIAAILSGLVLVVAYFAARS